jgi:hypothetical protein
MSAAPSSLSAVMLAPNYRSRRARRIAAGRERIVVRRPARVFIAVA